MSTTMTRGYSGRSIVAITGLIWEVFTMDIKNVKFMYDTQEWHYEGTAVQEEKIGENWDFPCPACHSPAEMTSCSVYAEHHKCLNSECLRTFEVK